MKQLKVGLDDALRSQLEAAAARSGRSLADEIRQRLEWTLDLEPVEDESTRELARAVTRLAAEIELETGGAHWYFHDGAHTAFRQGVLWILNEIKAVNLRGVMRDAFGDAFSSYRPGPNIAFGPRPHRTTPADDPQIIGLSAALEVWTDRNASREDREHRRANRERLCHEILERQQRGEQEGDKS